ncbi:hypothetical protein [Calothrix sp. CCY 0018]
MYLTQDKPLVSTAEERAKIAELQAAAQQRVEELLAKLKELGIEQ